VSLGRGYWTGIEGIQLNRVIWTVPGTCRGFRLGLAFVLVLVVAELLLVQAEEELLH
jgi:hypothetical protein